MKRMWKSLRFFSNLSWFKFLKRWKKWKWRRMKAIPIRGLNSKFFISVFLQNPRWDWTQKMGRTWWINNRDQERTKGREKGLASNDRELLRDQITDQSFSRGLRKSEIIDTRSSWTDCRKMEHDFLCSRSCISLRRPFILLLAKCWTGLLLWSRRIPPVNTNYCKNGLWCALRCSHRLPVPDSIHCTFLACSWERRACYRSLEDCAPVSC